MLGRFCAIAFGALVIALGVSACYDATRPLNGACEELGWRDTTVTAQISGNLVQRVHVSPLSPCPGQDITIDSELEVIGTDSVSFSSRICGLDVAGSLETAIPPHLIVCGGYSMGGTRAPGAIIKSGTVQRIESPSGAYTLQIRHSLSPSYWITVPIVVRSY